MSEVDSFELVSWSNVVIQRYYMWVGNDSVQFEHLESTFIHCLRTSLKFLQICQTEFLDRSLFLLAWATILSLFY